MADRYPCWRGRLGKGEEGESNHGGASAQAVQELPLDRRRSGTSGRQARRSRNPVLRVFHLVVYVRGHDRRGHRGNLRPPPARRYARGNAAQGSFDDEEPTSVTLCTGRIMAHSETGTSDWGATRRLPEQLIPRERSATRATRPDCQVWPVPPHLLNWNVCPPADTRWQCVCAPRRPHARNSNRHRRRPTPK